MKIIAISGCRSELDIISSVIERLKFKNHDIKVILSGSHLSNWHGNSLKKIKFKIASKIYSDFGGDKKDKRTRAISALINGITKTIEKEKPNFLIYAGDREEGIAAAIACNYMDVLFVHIAGGDPVWGNADDPIRFAISKLSHIHFTFTKKYYQNLLNVGEEKFRICNSGNPSLDNIRTTEKLSLKNINKNLKVSISKKYVVLIKHPLSSEERFSKNQMKITLKALKNFSKKNLYNIVVIYPNTDPGSLRMIKEINKYKKDKNFFIFKNLPHNEFVNLIRMSSALIGNSSMGFLEAPYYKIPVINVGRRQTGRLNAGNVKFVNYDEKNIISALNKACFDTRYLKKLKKIKNLYGKGFSSKKIVNFLEKIDNKDNRWSVKRNLC